MLKILASEAGIKTAQMQRQKTLKCLLATENTTVCLKGQLHRYRVNTLKFTPPAAGGYKFELTAYRPGPC
ncbi:MAG: hypothetical protein CL693_02685 [Cellvibrionaceae bacterium]|nr:hypothetical protein [Cellvibrionaceae bacterium]